MNNVGRFHADVNVEAGWWHFSDNFKASTAVYGNARTVVLHHPGVQDGESRPPSDLARDFARPGV